MKISKQSIKNICKGIWDFFCTRMPFISIAVIIICWAVYLMPKEHKSIEDYGAAYWNRMHIICDLTLVFGVLFVLSLIAYLFHKPLPEERKGLHIFLRIMISATALTATATLVWISLFIFSGAGY